MNIGVITFHWVTNYGAVLQAYALQSHLTKLGHNVQVIDYMPRTFEKTFAKCFVSKRPAAIKKYLVEYLKEKKFVPFRRKHFQLTPNYGSVHDLRESPPRCDVYICGSDQIWNTWFTLNGEGCVTTSYFLDFGNEKTTRIAYAVSFGCEEYADDIQRIVAPLLRNFSAISAREETGCKIIRSMGFDNVSLVPDPALLLTAEDYDGLLKRIAIRRSPFAFCYLMHDGQHTATQIEEYFRQTLLKSVVSTKELRYSIMGVPDWLSHIKNSELVITNSFHGVVLSIIYKKDFFAIPVEGPLASMNDRIFTLLKRLNLQDRILNSCEPGRISKLVSEPINWDSVEKQINALRKEADVFLKNALKQHKVAP